MLQIQDDWADLRAYMGTKVLYRYVYHGDTVFEEMEGGKWAYELINRDAELYQMKVGMGKESRTTATAQVARNSKYEYVLELDSTIQIGFCYFPEFAANLGFAPSAWFKNDPIISRAYRLERSHPGRLTEDAFARGKRMTATSKSFEQIKMINSKFAIYSIILLVKQLE